MFGGRPVLSGVGEGESDEQTGSELCIYKALNCDVWSVGLRKILNERNLNESRVRNETRVTVSSRDQCLELSGKI